jgi:hypothetical protein
MTGLWVQAATLTIAAACSPWTGTGRVVANAEVIQPRCDKIGSAEHATWIDSE